MDLDSMKYAELRSLAKELGLKGNMKAEKLLKAIKQHYGQEKSKEEERKEDVKDVQVVQDDENAAPSTVSAQDNEEVSSSTVFVNTRRGKGAKRKTCDPSVDTDAQEPPGAAQGETEVASSSAKKRKVSSAKDSAKTENEPPEEHDAVSEQQSDVKDEALVQDKTAKVVKPGKIPRYTGAQLKNKPPLKSVTPNFKKLHEAHFNKMESIDSYVQRKTKQMDTYGSSVNELKKPVDKTKLQKVEDKTQMRANVSRTSMFSPAPVNKSTSEGKRRHTVLSASKPPQKKPAEKEEAKFRPTVLSTRRINVRFSEATHDNEYKKSLVKTPARMSPCVTTSTPKQSTVGAKPNTVKPPALSATKIPGTFVFTGNTSTLTTPGSQKPSFDLKASLSRPLTYKPHTGKLKPFGEAKENTARNNSQIVNSHQENYKQHQVQTRGDRRAKQVEDRKQKKENMLGARRGLVMM